MAIWFRQLYPHLAIGAWASSAPTFALVDYIQYKEVVGASIHHAGGRACYLGFKSVFSQTEELITTGQSERFRQLFQLCSSIDINNKMDVALVFGLMTDAVSALVQYHEPGTIETFCDNLFNVTEENSTDVERFSVWFKNFIFGDSEECLENYEISVEFMRNTSWDSIVASAPGKQWIYQTCAEFGWYRTTDSNNQPFGSSVPVAFYIQLCTDIFGKA